MDIPFFATSTANCLFSGMDNENILQKWIETERSKCAFEAAEQKKNESTIQRLERVIENGRREKYNKTEIEIWL